MVILIFGISIIKVRMELDFDSYAKLSNSASILVKEKASMLVLCIIAFLPTAIILIMYYYDLFLRFYKKSGVRKPKMFSRVTIVLVIVYILSLITTTPTNVGPMLFGGILALWLYELNLHSNKDADE